MPSTPPPPCSPVSIHSHLSVPHADEGNPPPPRPPRRHRYSVQQRSCPAAAAAGVGGSSACRFPSRAAPRSSATPTRALACPPVLSSRKLAHLGGVSGLAEAVMMMREAAFSGEVLRCSGWVRARSLSRSHLGRAERSLAASALRGRCSVTPKVRGPRSGGARAGRASQCPPGGGGSDTLALPSLSDASLSPLQHFFDEVFTTSTQVMLSGRTFRRRFSQSREG